MERNIGSLNEHQFTVLMQISKDIDLKGYPPSMRDLMKSLDISSTSMASFYINGLVKAGYIHREFRTSRGMKILVEPCKARLNFDPNEVFAKESLVGER